MHALALSAALLCFVTHYVISAPGALDTALEELVMDSQDIALQDKPMVSPANDYNSFVHPRAASSGRRRRRRRYCILFNARGKCTRWSTPGFWGGR